MRKYFLLTIFLSHTFIGMAQAYVHVRDEPRHHNVFENQFVRVLDVYLGPGDTSLFHLHNTPSVFIVLSNSNVGSRLLGGQPQKGANVNGEVSYDQISTPRTHQVWNEDTNWFHVMDIELTSKNQKGNVEIVKDPSLKLLFNEQQVNGYGIDLKAKTSFKLPASLNGYLLICKSNSTIEFKVNNEVQQRIMKDGHYVWIEANKTFSLQAVNEASFVLLQLK